MNNCTRCPLHKTRVNIVRGRGSLSAKILVIGEAPGQSEDVLGKAFIGESGQFLDELLERAGINPENCYFVNTVLCHPCEKIAGKNREPLEEEVLLCMPMVLDIIEKLNGIRGTILAGKFADKFYKRRVPKPVISITHPSALLKQGGTVSSFYRDNLNKLKDFYEDLQLAD